MSKKKFDVIVADCPWPFFDSLKMSDVKRGAKANYNTMTMQQIKQLPVKSVCNPEGAVLCLWVPGSLLQDGLDTMKAWGFNHKQTYVWVKTKKDPLTDIRKIFFDFWKMSGKTLSQLKAKQFSNYLKGSRQLTSIIDYNKGKYFIQNMLAFGMGRLFRQTHELCLIGTNNNKVYKKLQNKSQRSVSFAENLKHSAKPEDLQNSLEIMFPNSNYLEMFGRRDRHNWTVIGNESPQTFGEDILVSLNKL